MPFIENSDYKPPFLFRNSYVNTIYPVYFRKHVQPRYERVRLDTPDEDFLDLDFSRVGGKNLVIVLHGLEGSSQSQYARGISVYFNGQKCDALAVNHRGCSEENNLRPHSYHMGATDDLRFIIDYLIKNENYEKIWLVGFSLGGNITLKYLGEESENLPEVVKGAAVFSVPIDIPSANEEIRKRKNTLYLSKFLETMKAKAQDKMVRLPEEFPVYKTFNPKTFNEFDEMITAPVHGFDSAEDYWIKSSSIRFIPDIKIPTLLVNAQDDTFLSEKCYPIELAKQHPFFYFEMPKYGGHCGFYEKQKDNFVWYERRAWDFLSSLEN